MAKSSKFEFTIDNFEGDHDTIDFFFTQARAYIKSRALSKDDAAMFLKTKFKGPALKYLIENTTLANSNDIDFIEAEFKKFFKNNSSTTYVADLHNLALLPQESIKNFAHRLNVLYTKVYPHIKDKPTVDNFKLIKFLHCLPCKLKTKIQAEAITDYDTAVDRAQTLFEIYQQKEIIDTPSSSVPLSDFQQQLLTLTEKINTLSFQNATSGKHNRDNSPNVRNTGSSYQNFKRDFKSRNNFVQQRDFRRFKPNDNRVIRCQICDRVGHQAKSCYQFTKQNIKKRESPRFNRKFKKNNNSSQHLNYQ